MTTLRLLGKGKPRQPNDRMMATGAPSIFTTSKAALGKPNIKAHFLPVPRAPQTRIDPSSLATAPKTLNQVKPMDAVKRT